MHCHMRSSLQQGLPPECNPPAPASSYMVPLVMPLAAGAVMASPVVMHAPRPPSTTLPCAALACLPGMNVPVPCMSATARPRRL